MDHKTTRKNAYRKPPGKKKAKLIRSGILGLKIMAGIGALLMVSDVFVLGYDFLTQCDYFRAKNIHILGNHRLSNQQILTHLRINTATNILSVNLNLSRKKLLAHPWIAEAEIRRELPDRLMINIAEHDPVAVIDLGRKFLINAKGEIFKSWDPADGDLLPVISGLEFLDIDESGKPQSLLFKAIMTVLRLSRRSDSILPSRHIKKILVDRETGISLCVFEKNQTIKLGFDDYPKKYETLQKVWAQMKKLKKFKDFDSIDLNNLERIVVNPIRIEASAKDQREV